MKSHSSTTRSKRRFRRFLHLSQILTLVAATGIVSPGCAVTPPPAIPDATRPSTTEPPAEKATYLDLEYGNRSSKASLRIDLSGTDVQLDMSGTRTGRDSAARAAAKASAAASADPAKAGAPTPTPAPEDEGTAKARRLVETTRAPADPGSDSALRKVVQHIRKSQELFYAGRYAEAEDNARRANEIRPTAEGLALAGSIAWVRKDRETARRRWQAARELDPDFPGLDAVLDSSSTRQEPSR